MSRTKVAPRILKVRKGATLKEIYAAAKKAFTAADLQRYAEDEPMIPAKQLLADLEIQYKKLVAKNRTNGRPVRSKK